MEAPREEAELDFSKLLRKDVLEAATLERIREALAGEQACVIRDALDPVFAERVHAALDGTEAWELAEQHARPFHSYRFRQLVDRADFPDAVLECERAFSSLPARRFASELSGADCMGPTDINVTCYGPGDHQFPHSDFGSSRTVSFVWSLTKDWRREWGGHFFWCVPPANVVPTFNTLVLFRVSKTSFHVVCPVSPEAQRKRLTVSGWWTSRSPLGDHPGGQSWYRGPLEPIAESVYVIR